MWQEEPRYERGDYIFAWEEHILFMLKQKEKNLTGPAHFGIKSQLWSGWGVGQVERLHLQWVESIYMEDGGEFLSRHLKGQWCVWQKTHRCWVRVERWPEDKSNFPSSIPQSWTNMIRVVKSQMGNFRLRSPQIKMLPSFVGVDEIIRFWEKRDKENARKHILLFRAGGCSEIQEGAVCQGLWGEKVGFLAAAWREVVMMQRTRTRLYSSR